MRLRLYLLVVCLTVMEITAEEDTTGDQQQQQQSLEDLDSTESSELGFNFYNTRWHTDEEDNLVDEENADDQDWDRVQSKRFLTLFRNRPPKSEGYKRGPGFRSWGGKRGDKLFEGGKRRPFQSWGGKRNLNDDWLAMQEKRKFSSWGGKRSQNSKKKFLSWGGKRANEFVMN